jgi:hypothetical protein
MGKNGRILFDRPKPTVGCSANGRKRRRRRISNCDRFHKLITKIVHICYEMGPSFLNSMYISFK